MSLDMIIPFLSGFAMFLLIVIGIVGIACIGLIIYGAAKLIWDVIHLSDKEW